MIGRVSYSSGKRRGRETCRHLGLLIVHKRKGSAPMISLRKRHNDCYSACHGKKWTNAENCSDNSCVLHERTSPHVSHKSRFHHLHHHYQRIPLFHGEVSLIACCTVQKQVCRICIGCCGTRSVWCDFGLGLGFAGWGI